LHSRHPDTAPEPAHFPSSLFQITPVVLKTNRQNPMLYMKSGKHLPEKNTS